MAASRGQTPPPVNLKERIAALQQRNVSPTTHSSAQAAPRLPSGGVGGLRDKIAKFEGKGGVPVPRGSFAMGAPQLTENAPPKKRGELYGNRPGLGRPSAAGAGSRAGSPLPSSDDAPGPRKRCISTGATLSSNGPPSVFSTDEPVPPLPNGLTPRRNSLAVNFGSGRRVASVDGVDALVPEKRTESAEVEPPVPESAAEEAVSSVEEVETVEEPLPAEPSVDNTPVEDTQVESLADASPNIPESQTPEGSSKDGHSDYESAPQSAVSLPSPSPPEPIPSPVPVDTPPIDPVPTRADEEAAPDKPVASSKTTPMTISTPSPSEPLPPSATTPTLPSKTTFKAVVHRKVTELPISPLASNLAPPETPQPAMQRRGVVEVPPSPGIGDLAVLLEDAALLELKLTEGGDGSKAKDLLAVTPTSATFHPDPRHASASTLTEHVPAPSVGSGSQSARSVSIPSIREPSGDDEIDGRSLASTTFSQRSPSHRNYLSNIYRLTGRRSSSYMPGAYPRDSLSLSSEDSSPVTTPSDNGKRKGFGIAWPSSSPKKGGLNISRSSSFADKIFNRSRTRSNVSMDQASERTSLYGSQPSLAISFPSELSPDAPPDSVEIGARPTSWISPGDSNSEFSPASSLLDRDIFDAFPSVPQTLPPGFHHMDVDDAVVGRASTLPVHGQKQAHPRLSMV